MSAPYTPKSTFYTQILSNPLRTREDVASALTTMLDVLEPYTSPGGARIHLGETGAHFDDVAAELEGFSRPLWALASLIAGGDGVSSYVCVERWVRGLANGTNTADGGEFWGNMRDRDQRMVECSAIGYTLAVAGDVFWERLNAEERKGVEGWLGGLNDKDMPSTNWLWFRVFTNLGLSKVSSSRFDPERMKSDLDHLDTFYIGDGWSRDGPEGIVQLDYYSSSFAIQVAQLLYSKLAEDIDPVRCEEFRKRAKMFATDFIYYFDPQGRSITFGRSLTYRFATAAFWSAFAYCIPASTLPAPFTLPTLKGLVLRNLRSWLHNPILLRGAFTPSGILTLGYAYPNTNMLENYNSPGSPYWAFKLFICLAMRSDEEFWMCEEGVYPSLPAPSKPLVHAFHLTLSSNNHTFILSSGQQASYPVKHAAAKYGKFAYSSAFGYSVPSGAGGTLEEQGGDSVLVVSDGNGDSFEGGVFAFEEVVAVGGEGGGGGSTGKGGVYGYGGGGGEGWRARRQTKNPRFESSGSLVYLRSTWDPYPDLSIETFLVPPCEDAPMWYLRVHRVRFSPVAWAGKTKRRFWIAEGGWAVGLSPGTRKEDLGTSNGSGGEEQDGIEDKVYSGPTHALGISKKYGVSGIVDLTSQVLDSIRSTTTPAPTSRRGIALLTDPNTSLMFPRAVVPTLRAFYEVEVEVGGDEALVEREEWLVTGVFGYPFNHDAEVAAASGRVPVVDEDTSSRGRKKGTKEKEKEKKWKEEWDKRPVVPGSILELMKGSFGL